MHAQRMRSPAACSSAQSFRASSEKAQSHNSFRRGYVVLFKRNGAYFVIAKLIIHRQKITWCLSKLLRIKSWWLLKFFPHYSAFERDSNCLKLFPFCLLWHFTVKLVFSANSNLRSERYNCCQPLLLRYHKVWSGVTAEAGEHQWNPAYSRLNFRGIFLWNLIHNYSHKISLVTNRFVENTYERKCSLWSWNPWAQCYITCRSTGQTWKRTCYGLQNVSDAEQEPAQGVISPICERHRLNWEVT